MLGEPEHTAAGETEHREPESAHVAQLREWLRRGTNEIFTVTTVLTPDMAQWLLGRNPMNRDIRMRSRKRSVGAYAAAMARGEWALNGQPLVMARSGAMNDGQHRCVAVVKSGVSIPVMITFGVERETRTTLDQGAGRTPGDILKILGYSNCSTLGSAIGFMYRYLQGATAVLGMDFPSEKEMIQTLELCEGLEDDVKAARSLVKPFRLSAGYMAGAIHLCRQFNSELAEAFYNDVQLGIGGRVSPVWQLRKRYASDVTAKRRMPSLEQAALYIKAFNAYISGRSLQVLSWGSAEDFPVPGKPPAIRNRPGATTEAEAGVDQQQA